MKKHLASLAVVLCLAAIWALIWLPKSYDPMLNYINQSGQWAFTHASVLGLKNQKEVSAFLNKNAKDHAITPGKVVASPKDSHEPFMSAADRR